MKRRILAAVLVIAATATAGKRPDLREALENAKAAWGATAPVEIQYADLGTCTHRKPGEMLAGVNEGYTVISINQRCRYSSAMLATVVTHELGHVLARSEAHSDNPKSVMYYIVRSPRQVITDQDREKRTEKLVAHK